MKFPLSLTERPQWLCWRSETRKGKPTKVPYQTNGALASTTNPATWTTFEAAMRARPRFEGIGFVFTADDPFVGIDLDNCLGNDGYLNSDAREILGKLQTYTERSVSGTGVHAIGMGEVPAGGNRVKGIEIYDHGRYFVMTGEAIAGYPPDIRDITEPLAELHREIFPGAAVGGHPSLVKTQKTQGEHVVLDPAAEPPAEKFEALMANDPNFAATWTRERQLRDGSPSAYDLSLGTRAANAGWTDQEIVNLCIAGRRKHGDDLKLRADYWERFTLAKCRNGQKLPAKGDDTPLETLSLMIGLPIKAIVKLGAEKSRLRLELDDGSTIPIGAVDTLLMLARFRSRIFEATGRVVVNMKQAEWLKLCGALQDDIIHRDLDGQETRAQTEEWIAAFSATKGTKDWQYSFRNGLSFVRDEQLHLPLAPLLLYIQHTYRELITREMLAENLTVLGFSRTTIKLEDSQRSFWLRRTKEMMV
ncbi:MAG TPA: hypothetical protein VM223_18115 [Planctomycetota bacterium]|nr:hypothetical protein [Planctomycetota bacterium]